MIFLRVYITFFFPSFFLSVSSASLFLNELSACARCQVYHSCVAGVSLLTVSPVIKPYIHISLYVYLCMCIYTEVRYF